ncbi:MAG: hypothetical protein CM1200mP1_12830 [Candidatus Neomarinimicrobiota bacterium]|nr:MAG: hypothetical protein CM1200mP1_12830 [Candidatus Neomarinimicrobiota bacterium]
MLWETSPACTELEIHVLDWLADMLSLPNHFKSKKMEGESYKILHLGITMAMFSAGEKEQRKFKFIWIKRMPCGIYFFQAHSSIEKAAMIAGIGSKNIRIRSK